MPKERGRQAKIERAAYTIDRLISANVTSRGLIDGLYEAAYQ